MWKKHNSPIVIVAQQLKLRQSIPTVTGCIDYTRFCDLIQRIEEIIRSTDLDRTLIRCVLRCATKEAEADAKKMGTPFKDFSRREKEKLQEQAVIAARCAIARALLGESFRRFHIRLADSVLLQWFCHIDAVSHIRVPSKSSLERYEKYFPTSAMVDVNTMLLRAATGTETARKLELDEALSIESLYFDTTVAKTNIHFPVDWVMFRDAIRTLMKAVILIRKEGLVHRMDEPKSFLRSINRLCIQMCNARRKKSAKSERKRVLRLMKKLLKRVEAHARRHRDLLEKHRKTVNLGAGEVDQILKRIDSVLVEVKRIIFQAHERIIGERRISNEAKLLSLYEKDTRPIVRGKLGAETEFGNTLLLVEQADGLIVDWDLFKNQAPADSKMLVPSLERMRKRHPDVAIHSATTDRGFSSPENAAYLKEHGIDNHLCPRKVTDFLGKLEDPEFRLHQNRRSQTEGRIGIFKNSFLGRPLRSKGFVNRKIKTGIGVLSHNLWVLARIINEQILERATAA